MARKRRIDQIEVTGMSATGKGLCKIDGEVIFIDKAIPGDIVDIVVYRKKKSFSEAKVLDYIKRTGELTDPPCDYFGTCGGCKWQNIQYSAQLKYKEQQVYDNLTRIGKIDSGEFLPILPAPEIFEFRNKLEYTFSSKRWLSKEEIDSSEELDRNGVGFHIPGHFDKVLDIEKCHIQREPTNFIRNFIRDYAKKNNLSFYDVKDHQGLLRNLIIRTAENNQVMVILQVGENNIPVIENLLSDLVKKFQEITSCYYIINTKKNDSYDDLTPIHFSGEKYLTKSMEKPSGGERIKFIVGPKSFFQTNSGQAENLYRLVKDWSDIQPDEKVYDLYTGTGTIANYIAENASEVIGLEYVEEAVSDARKNAKLNGFDHLKFFSGDMKDLLTIEFFEKHGKPDVIITDPPRAGMHSDVCRAILNAEPDRIVYVSCNPATQARDIEILSEKYEVKKVRPVDMFPHTPHVENVVLLRKTG